MSWIFSFLLVCYATVRLVLWVRGQLRWMAIRTTLPAPPTEVEAPAHLSPGLAELFLASRQLRVDLIHARRALAAVRVTDPDAPLGQIRDRRYRRAVMESWTQIHAWLRIYAEAREGPGNRAILEDRRIDEQRVAALIEGLRGQWREVARARALDPFSLAELERAAQTLEAVGEELEVIEDGLSRSGDHPYRDRFLLDEQVA